MIDSNSAKTAFFTIISFTFFALIQTSNSLADGFSEKRFLILHSDYARIKAGDHIPATTTINLASKQLMRILGPSGKITKIRGEYTGSIGNFLLDENRGSNINLMDLANAIKGRGKLRKALGGYRGTDEESDSPQYKESIVRIIVGENQTYCISSDQQLALWRSDKAVNSLKLKLGAGKTREEINWPAGENEVRIPDSVISSQPKRIVLLSHENFPSTRARLWYGGEIVSPGQQLSWYESMGCDLQFESALTFYQTF